MRYSVWLLDIDTIHFNCICVWGCCVVPMPHRWMLAHTDALIQMYICSCAADLLLPCWQWYYKVLSDADVVDFVAPGVDTVVVVGISVPTPASMFFNTSFVGGGGGAHDNKRKSDNPNAYCTEIPVKIAYGDGDGVAPLRSALRSNVWATTQQRYRACASLVSTCICKCTSTYRVSATNAALVSILVDIYFWNQIPDMNLWRVIQELIMCLRCHFLRSRLGKQLVHLQYAKLQHATCLQPNTSSVADTCYRDVLGYIANASMVQWRSCYYFNL